MRDRLAELRERMPGAIRASRATARFSVWRQLAVALAAGVFMGIIGPLGSDAAPMGKRLAYWLSLMLTGTLFANLVTRWAVRIELFERRPWVWAGLVALAITPPLSVVVWLASGLTFGVPLHWINAVNTAPVVLLISLAMLALTVLSQRTPAQTHAASTGAPPTPFLVRLPPKLRGAEIHAVQAEDHYLRLHTSAGQDLILMRLADAIAELEGLEGAQVHRSWWVAKAAVVEAKTADGRATLTLKNSVVAPVSRTYARSLRESGWF